VTAAVVHSALPDPLTAVVDDVLRAASVAHRAHGPRAPLRAAEAAAGDEGAVALIGPFRSADVAEAVEATAPAGLPLLAPVATWAGVTRDDEPGCDDAARHAGTVLRLVARDTEVAARIAADVRTSGRALVVAGTHDYGRQLDGQLRIAGLPRAAGPDDADLVVLCGLAGAPEVERAAALAPLPLIAFDGVQGADLGAGRDVRLALPVAPADDVRPGEVLFFVEPARRAAELIAGALRAGARDRAALLDAMRAAGPFDAHGDPIDPPVWLWHADADWRLTPDRPL
jgi:ParB-like chromosome segregation protein Spo0J